MIAERAYSTRVAYHVARRLELRADPVEKRLSSLAVFLANCLNLAHSRLE